MPAEADRAEDLLLRAVLSRVWKPTNSTSARRDLLPQLQDAYGSASRFGIASPTGFIGRSARLGPRCVLSSIRDSLEIRTLSKRGLAILIRDQGRDERFVLGLRQRGVPVVVTPPLP